MKPAPAQNGEYRAVGEARLPPSACRLPPAAFRLSPAAFRLSPAACRLWRVVFLPGVFLRKTEHRTHRIDDEPSGAPIGERQSANAPVVADMHSRVEYDDLAVAASARRKKQTI